MMLFIKSIIVHFHYLILRVTSLSSVDESRVGRGLSPSDPSSNRTCGFPAYGLPMVFSCGMHASRVKCRHASSGSSLRQIRNSAWKHRSSLRLAAMYSWRWSSRTFSGGLLGLATMPSRLPPYTSMTRAGSLPSSGLVGRRQQ